MVVVVVVVVVVTLIITPNLTLTLSLNSTLTLPRFKPIADAMLRQMPGGRCPYPPLDVPGPGPGFDRSAHWVGP